MEPRLVCNPVLLEVDTSVGGLPKKKTKAAIDIRRAIKKASIMKSQRQLEYQRAIFLLIALVIILVSTVVPIMLLSFWGIPVSGGCLYGGYHYLKEFGLLMRADPYPDKGRKNKPPD